MTTSTYTRPLEKDDTVLTVSEFRSFVAQGVFIDYDGFGHPVVDCKADPKVFVSPSSVLKDIPEGATHIVWYNR